MKIGESLAGELRHEAATTRKLLERLPEDKSAWKPHRKSWSLLELASHVTNLVEWTGPTLDHSEFEMPKDYKPWRAASKSELLGQFDKNIEEALSKLAGYPDDRFMETWTLKAGGQSLFSMPKFGVLRAFVLNHLVHHRGQFSVYLRLLDVPVPSIYGPSADES